LLETDEGLALISEQNFLFIQIDDVETECGCGSCFPRQFKEKPVAVAFCVEVRSDVQVELIFGYLNCKV
jgi:hypothetical protein